MKRKVYVLSLLALGAIHLQSIAQTAPQLFPRTFEGVSPSKNVPVRAAKTSATGSRILGSSQYKSNGSSLLPVDSQAILYPGVSTALNDTTVHYTYTNGAWVPSYKDVFHYNASGMLDGYETLRWYTSNSTWNTYRKAVYTLSAGGYPTDIVLQEWNSTQSSWFNVERHIYTRDAAEYPTVYRTQQWNGTSNRWMDAYRMTYAYNGRHAYTQYTQEAWLELYGVWLPQTRLDYAYDASDTVMTLMNQSAWASNVQSWANVYRTYYTIDPTTHRPSGAEMKNFNANGLEQNFRRIDFDYDAAGLRTAETVEQWYSNNTYGNLYQILTTYNSAGQQTSEDMKFWRNNAWSYANADAYRNNTYYESYTLPLAVQPEGSGAIAALRLSPVPATNDVDIRMTWTEPQDFKVVIADLNGRVHAQLSQPAQQQLSTSISVSTLPAGNYLLSVQGAKGARMARMITITH